MVLPIYVYGSDVLRAKAQEVDITIPGIKEQLAGLLDDMWETMQKADGVGLAATQVGKLVRVLIVDGSLLSEDIPYLREFRREMINPRLLEESEELIEFNEGCLSIPDISAAVERSKVIKVSYLDRNLQQREEVLDNFACRMVQHEMDHLDGILFTDRTAPIRKKMLNAKLNNIKNGKANTHYKTSVKNIL